MKLGLWHINLKGLTVTRLTSSTPTHFQMQWWHSNWPSFYFSHYRSSNDLLAIFIGVDTHGVSGRHLHFVECSHSIQWSSIKMSTDLSNNEPFLIWWVYLPILTIKESQWWPEKIKFPRKVQVWYILLHNRTPGTLLMVTASHRWQDWCLLNLVPIDRKPASCRC